MKSCINLALSLSRGVFMMYLLIDERFLPDKSSMISCGWKASTRLEMLTRDLPTDQILILLSSLVLFLVFLIVFGIEKKMKEL